MNDKEFKEAIAGADEMEMPGLAVKYLTFHLKEEYGTTSGAGKALAEMLEDMFRGIV